MIKETLPDPMGVPYESLAQGLPHGPFRPLSMMVMPPYDSWMDIYLERAQVSGQPKAEAIVEIESGWTADQLSEAVEERVKAGNITVGHGMFMLLVLERWHQWPAEPARQLKVTVGINNVITFRRERQALANQEPQPNH